MKKDIAVSLQNISKVYKLYDKPIDRLKESLHPLKKKYHKDFYALKNINLEIKKGEVLGIVGVNGAGKSTLLKIISGVLTPTSGRVNIHGRINAILELGAGFKSEMTGLENIKLNLQINQIKDKAVLNEIINFADIGVHINQPVKTYSSGMKARLGFALATITKPDILIVDEALSVGDTVFKLKSYEKMKSLMQSGCTVLYVSHSLQSVIQLCTRAILLMNHTIVGDGNPKDIIEEYNHRLFSKEDMKKISKKSEKEDTKKIYKKGYFSKELVKEAKILKNYNVEIGNIKIYDKNQQIVNILEVDKEYTLKFSVHFNENIPNAMFGIQFKTLNGIFVYGIREESKSSTQIDNQNRINVIYKFYNNLMPNTYYLNIAAAATINGNIEYLVEYAECCIFKVIDNLEVKTNLISEYGIAKINGQIMIEEEKNVLE